MYKNIIFDLGGVMVDFDPKTYLVDRFCNAEVEEQVSQLTFESEEWKPLDAGLITRSEANLRMLARAKEYGRAFEVQGVLDDWMHILRPRRRMQELVRKLKSRGYCVYYLSNIPEDVLDFLTERDLKGLFDGGVASCEVHINKPDPASIRPCWTNTSSRPGKVFSLMTGWRMYRPLSVWALPASR